MPDLMKSDTRSAIIIVVTLVLARTTSGIMEASATRRFETPRTRSCWSTTAIGSSLVPILQVPEMWYEVLMLRRSQPSRASSVSRSAGAGGGYFLDDRFVSAVLQERHAESHGLTQPLAVPSPPPGSGSPCSDARWDRRTPAATPPCPPPGTGRS